MTIRITSIFLAAAFGAILSFPLPAHATDVYRADYSISLLGLRLAKSHFVTTIENGTFKTSGTLATAGLVRIFDRTDGVTSVSGRIEGSRVTPSSFVLKYSYGKKRSTTTIDFARGGVVKAENQPPVNKKGQWIAVTPDDLKAVTDPLSALLVAARSPRDICNRTLRVFDGSARVDLKLDFAGSQVFSTKGFHGTVTSCHVRFIPVSGYRKGVYLMRYLRAQENIRVSFASLGNSGIYAPVYAKVGTELGAVTVYATRFEATGETK